MSIQAIAAFAPSGTPQRFTAFARRTGITLTDGQLCFARVAYDGADPDGTERAARIFGRDIRIPHGARKVIVQVKGRDVGGSRLGALRLLHLAATLPLDKLDQSELAYAIFTGPKLRHAAVGMRFALMAAQRAGLKVDAEAANGFTIRRPDGRQVRLECFAAARGGDTGRGVPIVAALLDEAAFYFDETTGVVNDKAIFNALIPRLLPGGQILLVSSPWSEAGLLYEEFSKNYGAPDTSLAAFCPTLLLRDDPETRATVEEETKRDAVNAQREFGAKFMPVSSEQFFDPRAVDGAIDASIVMPVGKIYGAVQGWGGDFAFRSDSSALVGVQRGLFDGRDEYITGQIVEVKPDGGPLKPSAVVRFFANEMKASADTLMADSHYRQSIQEHLEESGLYLAPAPEGQIGKAETYQRARQLLHEGKCKIPRHERFAQQLKAVTWRPQPGGGVSIVSPRTKTGGHGDIVSAWVLAMWQCSLGVPEPAVLPAEKGTAAYERLREELRMQTISEEYVRETSDEADYYAQDNEWIRQ